MLATIPSACAYSNALLVAILPFVSDFATKCELPLRTPVTQADVFKFQCDPRGKVAGSLILLDGSGFNFEYGHICLYASPNSYLRLQDPDRIPEFFGPINMTGNEAVAMASRVLSRFEGPSVKEFLDQPPKLVLPYKSGNQAVARYVVEWYCPDGHWAPVRVEIDASNKAIRMVTMLATNFFLPDPKVEGMPVPSPVKYERPTNGIPILPLSPAASNALVSIAFPQFTEFAKKLQLPVGFPISSEMVTNLLIGSLQDSDFVEIELASGFRFKFHHGYVCSFESPDAFFTTNEGRGRKNEDDFVAPIHMNEEQMIAVAREALGRLGYTTNNIPLLREKPVLGAGPHGDRSPDLSRFGFEWEYEEGPLEPFPVRVVLFEIDAGSGILKSLRINATNVWRDPPKMKAGTQKQIVPPPPEH